MISRCCMHGTSGTINLKWEEGQKDVSCWNFDDNIGVKWKKYEIFFVFLKSEGQHYSERMRVSSISCPSNGVKDQSHQVVSQKNKKEVTKTLAQVMLLLQVELPGWNMQWTCRARKLVDRAQPYCCHFFSGFEFAGMSKLLHPRNQNNTP